MFNRKILYFINIFASKYFILLKIIKNFILIPIRDQRVVGLQTGNFMFDRSISCLLAPELVSRSKTILIFE